MLIFYFEIFWTMKQKEKVTLLAAQNTKSKQAESKSLLIICHVLHKTPGFQDINQN